ncbi:MAG: efflux RND transporter periplasmic adaptor subunit [Verrucomicrobiae bacterium]|nr:efflux RND transporter periplasmic adaptor subunit [Verrucomicrobiae bacterium]
MTQPRRGRARKLLILSAMALGLAALGGWAWWSRREPPQEVQTEPVTRRSLTERVVANGRIQAVTRVVINPEVSGEIVELPVREGQRVAPGDLLVRIRPDPYLAGRHSAEATHRSALAHIELARAELAKARIEFERIESLRRGGLVSDSDHVAAQTMMQVAQARYETATHQADQARAALARAEEDLAKTTIVAPIGGTVTSLRSERGERVVGTAMMAGTEIMTLADLSEMEARVDVGEIDVVLIRLGQRAVLEADAFRDRRFTGVVTEIANAARTSAAGTAQEATRFEVRIRIAEKEAFRPGMTVTAEIETRYRTNVLAVPLQSVTTRLPKGSGDGERREAGPGRAQTAEDDLAAERDGVAVRRRPDDTARAVEGVFVVREGRVEWHPVKRGIADDEHTEIEEGLEEGWDVVSGGYRAIHRELEDGKAVRVNNRPTAVGRGSEARAP